MAKRIIDLVNEKKYDELKTVLEAKVASKLVDKINEKKDKFISDIRSKKRG